MARLRDPSHLHARTRLLLRHGLLHRRLSHGKRRRDSLLRTGTVLLTSAPMILKKRESFVLLLALVFMVDYQIISMIQYSK